MGSVHRKEEGKKCGMRRKKPKEKKNFQVQLCSSRVSLLCYLNTSKLCVFQPVEKFLQGSIQRESLEKQWQLITDLGREMGEAGTT